MKLSLPPTAIDIPAITAKLDEIAHFLTEYQGYQRPASLMGGDFGTAIFLAQYADFANNEACSTKAIELIETSYEYLSQGRTNASFCNGLAGFGWGLHYLIGKGLLEIDFQEIHDSIGTLIAKDSLRLLQEKEYDFLHRGSGGILYFLELAHQKDAKEYLEEAVSLLHQSAVFDGPFIKWQHDPWKRLASYKGVNTSYVLGLAHGVPSILSLLSRIYEKGIAKDTCHRLTEGIIPWIKSMRLPEGFNSLYPSSETLGAPPTDSRLGWCYGDLGIARALLTAGQVFNNTEWLALAEEIYLFTSKRLDPDVNKIKDAAICHGSIGISHLFYDAWQHLQRDELLQTSNYWMEQTLKFAKYPSGYCGYQYATEKGPENTTIFLNGITGIGFGMLNRIHPPSSGWDRMLLMN